jgi:hypothetical protein
VQPPHQPEQYYFTKRLMAQLSTVSNAKVESEAWITKSGASLERVKVDQESAIPNHLAHEGMRWSELLVLPLVSTQSEFFFFISSLIPIQSTYLVMMDPPKEARIAAAARVPEAAATGTVISRYNSSRKGHSGKTSPVDIQQISEGELFLMPDYNRKGISVYLELHSKPVAILDLANSLGLSLRRHYHYST